MMRQGDCFTHKVRRGRLGRQGLLESQVPVAAGCQKAATRSFDFHNQQVAVLTTTAPLFLGMDVAPIANDSVEVAD